MHQNIGLIFRSVNKYKGISKIDDRQITHLICVRLKHLLCGYLGVFWASFLLFFLYRSQEMRRGPEIDGSQSSMEDGHADLSPRNFATTHLPAERSHFTSL